MTACSILVVYLVGRGGVNKASPLACFWMACERSSIYDVTHPVAFEALCAIKWNTLQLRGRSGKGLLPVAI